MEGNGSRSLRKGDAAELTREQNAAKKEFIVNLHQMMHFYNNLDKINPQFNPFEGFLKKSHSTSNIPLGDGGLNYKTASSFKYEQNPYKRETLVIKKSQVVQYQAHLAIRQESLARIAEQTANVTASDRDLDVLINSNVKWFETATQALQEVERITALIQQQENANTESEIKKKELIINEADRQNEEYQTEIELLDKLIAEKQQQDIDVKAAIDEEKRKLQKELSQARSEHRIEINRKNSEIFHLSACHEKMLGDIHEKVKAIFKKRFFFLPLLMLGLLFEDLFVDPALLFLMIHHFGSNQIRFFIGAHLKL